jgi:Cys-tRNA(Pro) deacylase
MMAKIKIPVTAALRFLKQAKVNYTPHLYTYEERGGTVISARELKVTEHAIIKTLIMEDDKKSPLVVLMHGDMEVSTKELARAVGVKSITPCTPDTAFKHTGYQVGGTSPFATRKKLPVYMEESIAGLEVIYINGGKRGFLVSLSSRDVLDLLKPKRVKVGIK